MHFQRQRITFWGVMSISRCPYCPFSYRVAFIRTFGAHRCSLTTHLCLITEFSSINASFPVKLSYFLSFCLYVQSSYPVKASNGNKGKGFRWTLALPHPEPSSTRNTAATKRTHSTLTVNRFNNEVPGAEVSLQTVRLSEVACLW